MGFFDSVSDWFKNANPLVKIAMGPVGLLGSVVSGAHDAAKKGGGFGDILTGGLKGYAGGVGNNMSMAAPFIPGGMGAPVGAIGGALSQYGQSEEEEQPLPIQPMEFPDRPMPPGQEDFVPWQENDEDPYKPKGPY